MGDCKGTNQGLNKPTKMAVKAHASAVSETACSDLICPAVTQEYKIFVSCGYVCLQDYNSERQQITVLNRMLLQVKSILATHYLVGSFS